MYTLIIIDGQIQIEVEKEKDELLLEIRDFLKDKIVISHTEKGLFNGLGMLASKLVQHLENNEEKENYPSSIWLYGIEETVNADGQIVISKGDVIELDEKETTAMEKYEDGFRAYEILKKAQMINVEDVSTIKNLKEFKKDFVHQQSKH